MQKLLPRNYDAILHIFDIITIRGKVNARGGYFTMNSLQIEYGILICIGLVGIIGNVGIIGLVTFIPFLRKSANAFICHHCVLDLLKALYCLIFANSVLHQTEPQFCNLLGGSFIICVTSSAFNILAMVMCEAYVFSDLTAGVKDSGNYCCVAFGVSTIWFASIILNLGVAFLPGNPSYVKNVGHCTFAYGLTRNYVLYILWTMLVTFAISLTAMYLRTLYRDIRTYPKTNVLKIVIEANKCEKAGRRNSENVNTTGRLMKHSLRKLYILIVLTAIFIISWYPLFMLTLLDPSYDAPPRAYKSLTIFACANSSLNPFVFTCLIRQSCSCRNTFVTNVTAKDSRSGPPTDDESHLLTAPVGETQNLQYGPTDNQSGILNQYFRRADVDSERLCGADQEIVTQQVDEILPEYDSQRSQEKFATARPFHGIWSPSIGATSTL